MREHGGTEAPGPYWLEDLVEDVRALPAELAIGSTHFVGLSMAGMIEQVPVAYPVLVDSLLLADALSACGKVRIAAAGGSHSMESLVELTVARWFTEPFLQCQSGHHRRDTRSR